jgi:hypothetical protein
MTSHTIPAPGSLELVDYKKREINATVLVIGGSAEAMKEVAREILRGLPPKPKDRPWWKFW